MKISVINTVRFGNTTNSAYLMSSTANSQVKAEDNAAASEKKSNNKYWAAAGVIAAAAIAAAVIIKNRGRGVKQSAGEAVNTAKKNAAKYGEDLKLEIVKPDTKKAFVQKIKKMPERKQEFEYYDNGIIKSITNYSRKSGRPTVTRFYDESGFYLDNITVYNADKKVIRSRDYEKNVLKNRLDFHNYSDAGPTDVISYYYPDGQSIRKTVYSHTNKRHVKEFDVSGNLTNKYDT